MKSLRIILSVFLVVGILLLLGAGALVLHTERFLSTAIQTQGTVTALIPHVGSNGNSYTYNPQFTFHTQDGRTITVISSSGSNPPAFSEGDPVTILYQPAQPQSARIDSFSQLWIGPLILGILGFVFTGIGCIVWLVSGRGAALQKRLIGKGQQVTANVTGVELDSSLEVNGRFPWRVSANGRTPPPARSTSSAATVSGTTPPNGSPQPRPSPSGSPPANPPFMPWTPASSRLTPTPEAITTAGTSSPNGHFDLPQLVSPNLLLHKL